MARKKKTVEMKKSQLPQAVWVDDDDQESDVHANYPSGTRIGMRNADESPVRYLDEAKPEEHRKRLREQYKLSTVHGRQPKWARMEGLHI
jgi:3-methyladenine DNA glycosylase Mpg